MISWWSIHLFFYGRFISWFNFFHYQQHQYFVSVIESMQEDQYFLIKEYGIHQKQCLFTFVNHDRSFIGNHNAK